VKEMGENLYEVDHFYTGDFAQFLTGGYKIGCQKMQVSHTDLCSDL